MNTDTFTVSQLAKTAKVTPDAIRHYVRIGLLQPGRNEGNGYKLFTPEDLQRVRFIRKARNLGYTLSDIQSILDDSNKGQSPCPKVRQIIEQRIEENKRRIQELQSLQTRMENALKKWRNLPDGIPDGDCICHLIEAINGEV
jgi:DNA-binding transcriptional MerR regulator